MKIYKETSIRKKVFLKMLAQGISGFAIVFTISYLLRILFFILSPKEMADLNIFLQFVVPSLLVIFSLGVIISFVTLILILAKDWYNIVYIKEKDNLR